MRFSKFAKYHLFLNCVGDNRVVVRPSRKDVSQSSYLHRAN